MVPAQRKNIRFAQLVIGFDSELVVPDIVDVGDRRLLKRYRRVHSVADIKLFGSGRRQQIRNCGSMPRPRES
jgi:hypothetical protein